jgi:hypothetical protein
LVLLVLKVPQVNKVRLDLKDRQGHKDRQEIHVRL